MKQIATRLILASGFLLILIIWAQSLATIGRPAAGGSVPAVQYLGESGSYEIDPSQYFLVKPVGRLRFVVFPGPTYAAQPGERVWSMSGDEAPDPLNHTTATIGPVDPGCVVRFTIVDDDPDERINHFKVNGNLVYTAAQGMVSSGQFIVNESGTLKIEVNDSIGLWVEPCESTVTLTPTVTPTGTATSTPTTVPTDTPVPTATDVPTETPEPTITPTVDPSATATPTPRYTPPVRVTAQVTLEVPSTETPVPTATSTAVPTETPTVLPTVPPTDLETVTPTPTEVVNWEPACLRINFDIGGDHALQGSYVVREVNGRTLYSWPAEAGWQDSGWIYDIDITFEAVYVDVWFYPGDGSAPIMMDMLNPAPGTTHGWLSRGQCHALEVAWSGGDQFATPVTGGNLNP